MSEHKVTLKWERGGAEFSYQKYPRDHIWSFDGGHTMAATAAPAYLGNPAHVDPEEAFVASLSSCHMLTFLAIACKQRFVLDSYEDEAVGRALDHAGETGRCQRRAAFRHEHERRSLAFAFMFAERPHLPAGQWMCSRRPVLDAADVQVCGLEVQLLPAQIADLGGPQPMPCVAPKSRDCLRAWALI